MKRRISPATAIASVALFFSLTGAGLAANRYLITSLGQIKPSVRSQLHGERGARGLRGDAGTQGAQGGQGAKGDTGPQGPQGPSTSINWRTNYRASDTYTLTASNPEASPTASCPAGQEALTGGFHGSSGVIVTSSMPFFTTPPDPEPAAYQKKPPQPAVGWTATAEMAPGRSMETFQTWVVCG